MNPSPDPGTRVTLLGRLRTTPDDPATWAEFVAHYGPMILTWGRRWGLQAADAEDVMQTVLLKLARKLREFEYDSSKSFRNWLKTLAHHAWRDHADRQTRPGEGSGDSAILAALDELEARRDLVACLEQEFDQELLREAMARVQLRVAQRTWDAFRLLALENWTGTDAARKLGMNLATVYVARSKVQRMLRDEVGRLESEEDAPGN